MEKNQPWNNQEIHSAVCAYFNLLKRQQKNEKVNKAAIYRMLAEKHPSRSAKAFELKFQNISAVLYEQKLPYADGLRPLSNYQSAMKTVVLQYIADNGFQQNQQPIDILTDKLKRLRCKGFVKVYGSGSGRYGLTLEHHLSIPQNSSKEADFMGIELKTKTGSNTLQTLFSRTPTRYIACDDKNQLVTKFGYYDQVRERQALYTSFNSEGDTLGFKLQTDKNRIVINKDQLEILEYENSVIENALLQKHTETAYVSVTAKKLENGKAGCRFDKLLYCSQPSLDRFLHMADDGSVYLNLTLSEKNGRVKDHGFLWRVPQVRIEDLYHTAKVIEF